MKKIVFALAMTLVTTATAMAQDDQQAEPIQQGKPDKTEMVQRRTDMMAEKLGLNDEQKAQLLELNTKYADRMKHFGARGQRPGGRAGQRHEGDSVPPRPEAGKALEGKHPKGEAPRGLRRGGNAQDMAEYEQELQKILTPEQYEAYNKEKQNRPMPRGERPQRRPNHQD